jgi:hypothetical protein
MDLTSFWNQYWWAIIIGLGIVAVAIVIRSGIIGDRLRSLFSWPPQP